MEAAGARCLGRFCRVPVVQQLPECLSIHMIKKQETIIANSIRPDTYALLLSDGLFQLGGGYAVFALEACAEITGVAEAACVGRLRYAETLAKHFVAFSEATFPDEFVTRHTGEGFQTAVEGGMAHAELGLQEFHIEICAPHVLLYKRREMVEKFPVDLAQFGCRMSRGSKGF